MYNVVWRPLLFVAAFFVCNIFFSSSAVVVAAAFVVVVVVVRSTRANVMLLFNGRQMNLNGLLLCAVSREDVCRGKERESV